jgi:hypothetical protein
MAYFQRKCIIYYAYVQYPNGLSSSSNLSNLARLDVFCLSIREQVTGSQDQAQVRVSDAIRQTGLCSTWTGLRTGQLKISLHTPKSCMAQTF